jgi:hypothetical protein
MGCGVCVAEVLPAALLLDSVRFQFRDATERVAWSIKAGGATALALELAAASRNPELVADLVETHINSVVHSPRNGSEQSSAPSPDSFAPEERRLAARAVGIELIEAAENSDKAPFTATKPVQLRDGDGFENRLVAVGTTRLLGSSGLPGTPPPLLVVPSRVGHRLALAYWHNLPRYPPINRPRTPVYTW